MNRFRKIAFGIILAEIFFIIVFNVIFIYNMQNDETRLYRVETKRVTELLRKGSSIDLSEFDTIISVSRFNNDSCNNDYVVENINGELYRIEYDAKYDNRMIIFYMNISLICMMAATVFILLYVLKKILKPFDSMKRLPGELAKGNLAVPVKEEKNKYFGSFLWGMDMLRESLEDNKERELELQKERKTLILSLSHDIKMPLSAIELYTRALSDNLYDTKQKKQEALEGIRTNIKEIKNYVNEITNASREDFLNLDVINAEFYLSEVISFIQEYYSEKLSVQHIEFVVSREEDCIVKGDKNRVIEVLQNIMENAVKYGDGERIAISFCDEEDCKLINIENTGELPQEAEIPNLFDSFYRGSNRKNVKGSGLGLYICKNLMRKMDGDIFISIKDGMFCVTVVIRKA